MLHVYIISLPHNSCLPGDMKFIFLCSNNITNTSNCFIRISNTENLVQDELQPSFFLTHFGVFVFCFCFCLLLNSSLNLEKTKE